MICFPTSEEISHLSKASSSFLIDLYFPDAVNLERIDIYETYNPGAIVRILGCNKAPHQASIYDDEVK